MRLRSNLLRTRGRPRHLLGIDLPWERTKTSAAIENPWVFERGGLYYLLYSANDWQGAYGMGYAVSRSPAGPFRKVESKPLLSGRSGLHGPGGGSTVVGPRGMMWLTYHARRQAPGYRNWRHRTLHIDPLLVNHGRLALQGPSVSSRIRP